MKKVFVIRHVAFEDLGLFADVLEQLGSNIIRFEAGIDDISSISPLEADLLIILGGPIGVYEEDEYPFLKDELRLLEARISHDLPTIGICLGCQLIARSLGAGVYPGPCKEIGWSPLELTAIGEKSALRHLGPQQTMVLHWHGDTFDLPDGSELLASSRLYRNQAFTWGRNILALQFHPEVTVAGLERWFIGHACEIAQTDGLTVPDLRDDTGRYGATLEKQGSKFIREWLDARTAGPGVR